MEKFKVYQGGKAAQENIPIIFPWPEKFVPGFWTIAICFGKEATVGTVESVATTLQIAMTSNGFLARLNQGFFYILDDYPAYEKSAISNRAKELANKLRDISIYPILQEMIAEEMMVRLIGRKIYAPLSRARKKV